MSPISKFKGNWQSMTNKRDRVASSLSQLHYFYGISPRGKQQAIAPLNINYK
ncbi:MAG: hypothetical protein J7647_33000 [Cyanobacteria bacterium SBLK]|nr:hypothetical protein [Cyanobacteria bacterium SBLK]